MTKQTFILVHGSWHDGSAWQDVAEILINAGHDVVAQTLPGHGIGVNRNVRFEDYVEALVAVVQSCPAQNVILVGHSMGGAVVAASAERLAERTQRLIFISAIVPEHGEKLIDLIPPDSAASFAAMAAESTDNSIEMPWLVWRESFIGDGDISTARTSFAGLCPEPFTPVGEVIEMPGFATLETPRSYIHCRSDVAFPPGEWHFFPRFFNRLGLCRLIEIDAGHEAVYSAPALLAGAILDAARE